MKILATVLTVLALFFSTSVFAHGYGYQPQYRYVDRYGVPYYAYPTPAPCYQGCGHRGSGGWGGNIGYYGGQITGSIHFSQHRHYNGCGHYPPPPHGHGHGHRSQSYGGSINSYNGQVGGTFYYNQNQSN